MQYVAYGKAFRRAMGMLVPQPSQMPNWPSRIRSKAYSMRASSRLSTSASCELISSWTESSAASTMSPEVCARSSFSKLKSPARAFRNASRRLMRIWRMFRIASLRLIGLSPRRPILAALKARPPQSSRSRTPSFAEDLLFRPRATGGGRNVEPPLVSNQNILRRSTLCGSKYAEYSGCRWQRHFAEKRLPHPRI